VKRIVLKVGSAVLTENNRIARDRMQNLVDLIARLKARYEVILVSSGAVAAGYTELKLDKSVLANKQALASIGQPLLMNRYKKKFEKYGILPAQILVTAANFTSASQAEKARNTIDTLIENGVLPIINENDATAVEELVLGDNDQLSAYTAYHFGADMLVILSDINAYYNKDPHCHDDACVLPKVHAVNPEELSREVSPHNSFATGGIVTKLKAAHFLLERGRSMFLASGFELEDIENFLLNDCQSGGTLFTPEVLA